MDRFATKTRSEREDEEVERLIRKSPKDKPPRHDLRRERVDVEDPGTQKDASKEPSNPDLVNVRLKDDPTKVVRVTKKTLKEEPGKYEAVDTKESAPAQESEKAAPSTEEEPKKDKPAQVSDAEVKATLMEMIKSDPELGAILKDFTNPEKDMFQWAKSAPDTPADKFLRGRTPPKEIKTLGDLQRVLLNQDKVETPKTKKKKPAKPPEGSEVPAAEKPEAAPPQEGGPAPEAQPQQEAPKAEPPASEPKSEAPKKKTKKSPEEPEDAGVKPTPPARKVSKEERADAVNQLVQTFPPEITADLLLTRPPLHPDEVKSLIADYHTASALSLGRKGAVDNLIESVSKSYATTPSKVPAPKKAAGPDGKMVAYESLPKEEQAKAWREHQIRTVSMSIAARAALSNHFTKVGAPSGLAETLSNFMLSGKGKDPDHRLVEAAKAAEDIFRNGLVHRGPAIPDSKVSKVLESIPDQASKRLVVGYLQAQDYQSARDRYLDPKSPEHISERVPLDKFVRGLESATDFLRKRTAKYPEGMTRDVAAAFRSRVAQKYETLMPEKAKELQALLDESDNRNYDEAKKEFERSSREYQARRKEAEKQYAKELAQYNRLKAKGEEVESPVRPAVRLAEAGVVEPLQPTKPPRYDLQRKSKRELSSDANRMWENFRGRHASAYRVAKKASFSIYPIATAMAKRQAVYHGVQPYPKGHEGFEPYQGWQQAQARDLGEQDFSRILKAAKEWLGTPLLSTNIEGVVRDTQVRAALDLALRVEGYDFACHPTIYNNLLARLAGVSTTETLPTIRVSNQGTSGTSTTRETMSEKKMVLSSEMANRTLGRLDKLAHDIQANGKSWGLSFKVAKELVNQIDKLADELEVAAFGEASMLVRASEFTRQAQVVQRDADEPYMDTFKNPMQPIQTEADEPYMKAYGDDQSSAVHEGKSSTGRPLAP